VANALNINLKGKTVIFKQDHLQNKYVAAEHPYLVADGFGASPAASGHALMGEWIADGERDRMEGYAVERLATDEEIAAAQQKRSQRDTDRAVAMIPRYLVVALNRPVNGADLTTFERVADVENVEAAYIHPETGRLVLVSL
jgi:hypothetical protein